METEINETLATTRITCDVSYGREILRPSKNITLKMAMPRRGFIKSLYVETNGHRRGAIIETIAEHLHFTRSKRAVPHTVKYDNNVLTLTFFAEYNKTFTVHVTFEEALQRRDSVYAHTIYMKMSFAVRSFSVRYLIHDARGIEFVRSANTEKAYIRSEGKVKKLNLGRTCIDTASRVDANTFRINCEYSQYSKKLRNFHHMFGLEYEVSRKKGGNFIVKDNFFVHALDLGNLSKSYPNKVIFVLDISPGMSRKLQRKVVAGMVAMLRKMNTGDLVDYVAAGKHISFLGEPEDLLDAHELKKQNKVRLFFIRRRSRAKANLTLALQTAMSKLYQTHGSKHNPVILLMSSGFPLENGADKPSEIVREISAFNKYYSPIFSMVLGRFNHFAFFERLSNENFGFATKIYDTDDLESQMVKAFEKISGPSVKNAMVTYPSDTVAVKTDSEFPSASQGSEVLICGELNRGITPFQYDIMYDEGDFYQMDIFTSNTGEFLSDTTADVLKKLWFHMTLRKLSTDDPRLRQWDKIQLKDHLLLLSGHKSLPMASLQELSSYPDQLERFHPISLTFGHDDSVAWPEISLGRPWYHREREPTNHRPFRKDYRKDRARGNQSRSENQRSGSTTSGQRSEKQNCSQSSSQQNFLSLLTLSIPQQHPWNHTVRAICMVPQHVACKQFITILKYRDGTEMFIVQNALGEKSSRKFNLLAVYVREEKSAADVLGQYHGGMERRSLQGQHGRTVHTAVFFDRDNKLKVSSQETLHTITETSEDEITISTPSLNITMQRVCKPKAIVIKIHISPGQFFDGTKLSGGLLVDFIKMEMGGLQKFNKRKARKRCKKDSVASSLFPIIAGDNGGTKFCERII